MTVSVVIPVYNERAFVEQVLLRVQAAPIEKEIIVIDDGSTDGTRQLLESLSREQSAGKSTASVVLRASILPTSTSSSRSATAVRAQRCAADLRPRPAKS
jgi:cellulose synthase/poly-beta-1,6-N-acetylglucosamine synthase-like glycosyltransferase